MPVRGSFPRLAILSSALCVLALAAPRPAAAEAMEHAWSICSNDKTAPRERAAQCSALIESGKFKGRNLVTALMNRGIARDGLENYAGAIADYDEALKHAPDSAVIYLARGWAWLHSNDTERAIADFTRAIELEPDEPRYFASRATALMDRNENHQALADVDAALKLDPRDADLHGLRGQLLVRLGDHVRALAAFKVVLEIEPGNEDAAKALKSYSARCVREKVPEERVQACTAVIESKTAQGHGLAVAHGNRALALLSLKQYERALPDTEEAIKLDPSYPVAFYARAYIAHAKADLKAAIDDYTRAIALDANYVQAYLNRAKAFGATGAYDRTVADTTEVIRRDPQSALAFAMRGRAYAQLKDQDNAIADFTQALTLQPQDTSLLVARARAFTERRDFAHAVEDYSTVLKREPSYQGYALRASAHEEAGAPEQAIADYRQALAMNPELGWVRGALQRLGAAIPDGARLPAGDCSSDAASNEQRIAGCSAVIEGGKATGWTLQIAYCNLGYALTETGQFERVIETSDAALKLYPEAACGHLNRARGWYYKGDLDRAIADYDEAIRLDPQMHEAYASRGTAFFDRADFARAIADYSAAIAIEPKEPMYYSDRGNTYYRMKDYARAIADQTRAIEVEPAYAKAHVRRGWTYLDIDDYAKAEADFARALELAPGDRGAQAGLDKAREYRAHPEYAADDHEEAKGLNFDHFRSMVEKSQAPRR